MAKSSDPKPSKDVALPDTVLSPTIQAEIERQIGPLVPVGQREQIVLRLTQIVSAENFSGPIAHPRHLKAYEEVLPGSAERIVSMAERNLAHNAAMEKSIIEADIKDRSRGMWIGATALISVLVMAFVAGMFGNNILAGLLLTTAVLGAATRFINGRDKS